MNETAIDEGHRLKVKHFILAAVIEKFFIIDKKQTS